MEIVDPGSDGEARDGKTGHPGSMAEYWRKRWAKDGIRTVGNGSFTEEQFRMKTAELEKAVAGAIDPWFIGRRILDYGCGWGRWARILGDRAAEVFGIDISEEAVERARETYPLGKFMAFDGARMIYPDQIFGGVFAWTVLQHIPSCQIRETASDIERVLEPGGYLIIFENCSTWKKDAAHIWFRSPDYYRDMLFQNCELIESVLYPRTDGNDEDHVLMIFRRI